MPFTLAVHDDGHIASFTLTEPWSIHELIDPVTSYFEHVKSVSYRVHVVYDLREMQTLPSGIFNVRKLAPRDRPENVGYRAIVGVNGLGKTLVSAVFALARAPNVIFFDSHDEAWAYLRRAVAEETSHNQPVEANQGA